MNLNERQSKIMGLARTEGRVMVDNLASRFEVTTQTVRRDLNELAQNGLLSRVHGGAMLATSVNNIDYQERRALSLEAKRVIGAHAAAMIPDGCSLFLNIGTTTEQVAHALRERSDLIVVTNNINAVNILSGSPGKQIILAGGVVRESDGAIVGDEAVEFIRKFKVDFAVIGASALDDDGSIMDFDMREVAVARAIVANARRTILVSDRSKFARSAPIRICDIDEIDFCVMDQPPPAPFMKACARAGVNVEVAESAPAPTESDSK